MLNPDQQKVADRIVFTPAERAVLVEQLETLKVHCDKVIEPLKDGTPTEVMDAWVRVHIPLQYLTDVFSRKVDGALYDIMREEQG